MWSGRTTGECVRLAATRMLWASSCIPPIQRTEGWVSQLCRSAMPGSIIPADQPPHLPFNTCQVHQAAHCGSQTKGKLQMPFCDLDSSAAHNLACAYRAVPTIAAQLLCCDLKSSPAHELACALVGHVQSCPPPRSCVVALSAAAAMCQSAANAPLQTSTRA